MQNTKGEEKIASPVRIEFYEVHTRDGKNFIIAKGTITEVKKYTIEDFLEDFRKIYENNYELIPKYSSKNRLYDLLNNTGLSKNRLEDITSSSQQDPSSQISITPPFLQVVDHSTSKNKKNVRVVYVSQDEINFLEWKLGNKGKDLPGRILGLYDPNTETAYVVENQSEEQKDFVEYHEKWHHEDVQHGEKLSYKSPRLAEILADEYARRMTGYDLGRTERDYQSYELN